MSLYPEDYTEYVLKDIDQNKGRRRLVKASLLERALVRRLPPKWIHANPDDEFSMPEIGPNFGIVNDYVQEAGRLDRLGDTIYEKPVIVEKINPGGYMLLNGHHRWLAARRYGVTSLHVEVTNLTHTDHIRRALNKSKLTRRAAFDLDEVLLAGSDSSGEEMIPSITGLIGRRVIKERLRTGTIKLMKTLQQMGFDIWIYTQGYQSREYIHSLFLLYGLTISGCINASGRIQKTGDKRNRTNSLFKEKYKLSVNIDNESVLVVNGTDHTFEQYPIDTDDADWWADCVIRILEKRFLQ